MALLGLLPGPADCAVFAAAVLFLNATPGVDLLLTVSRTLQGGARAGVAAALGINAGCVVHALAAAFGLAALLAVVPAAFQALQWAGAAYLIWLGVGLWLQAATTNASAAKPVSPFPRRADFTAGVLTNVLNPKVALFFLAFLPQFVPAASPSKTASFLLLGLWFVLQSSLFLLLVVAATARLGGFGASPRVQRILRIAGGALFVALAVRLLRERPVLA